VAENRPVIDEIMLMMVPLSPISSFSIRRRSIANMANR